MTWVANPITRFCLGDVNILPQQEEVTSIIEKFICNYSDISRFDGISPDTSILTQLVSYPEDLDLVVAQQSALPLVEIDDGAVHQTLWCGPLIKGDIHPEVPAEKMLKHPCLRGWVGVPHL